MKILEVSEHDFPDFLVLAIETMVTPIGQVSHHLPFAVQDRKLRACYRDELRRRGGLAVLLADPPR